MDSVLSSFGSLKHSSSRADRNPAHFPWWISQCSYQGATSCPNLVIQSLFLFGSQKWTRTRRTSTPVSPPLPVLVLAAELKILLWNSFRPLSLLSFSKTGKQQLAPFSLHLLSLWEEFLVETIRQPITFTCEKTQRIVFWCSFFFFFPFKERTLQNTLLTGNPLCWFIYLVNVTCGNSGGLGSLRGLGVWWTGVCCCDFLLNCC